MYKARITRNDTLETIEASNLTLAEALRLVNVAWFSCGYNEEVLSACIIHEDTGRTLQAWWEDGIDDSMFIDEDEMEV